MVILGVLLAAQVATGDVKACRLGGGEAVPTAQVALEIAGAVLRGRESAEEMARYALHVDRAGKDSWDVVQSIPDHKAPNGDMLVSSGGLTIRIDRCDGRILLIQPFI